MIGRPVLAALRPATMSGRAVDAAPLAAPEPATFGRAFVYWLRLGFISFGGPFIESTHGNLKFTAPLTGITAAFGLAGPALSLTG